MSFKEPTEESEYAAVIAAAAFAITSLEPNTVMDRRQPQLGPQTVMDQGQPHFGPQFSLPRIISRIVDTVTSTPNQEPERIRDEHEPEETIPEKTIHPVPSMKRTPTMPKKRPTFAENQEDTKIPSDYIKTAPSFDERKLKDAKRLKPFDSFIRRTLSIKRTPTFSEEPFEGENNTPAKQRTKEEVSMARPPFPPPPIPPPPPAVPPLNIEPMAPQQGRQRTRNTDADEWEREELAKVKARYEKLNAIIQEWEDKKKTKARHKLDTTEVRFKYAQNSSCYKFRKGILTKVCLQEPHNELEKTKAKALENYQIEMERIKEIANGARAQAKAKRRNDELKVKEKANKYRETGEPPQPSICQCL